MGTFGNAKLLFGSYEMLSIPGRVALPDVAGVERDAFPLVDVDKVENVVRGVSICNINKKAKTKAQQDLERRPILVADIVKGSDNRDPLRIGIREKG